MKHIAIRSRSLRQDAPYTVPGLGDRLHTVMIGYNYSILHNTPVTLHLTTDKYHRPDKNASWHEILDLFPPGHVYVEGHEIKELPEHAWLSYLADKGISAETYYYKDYPHRYDFPKNVDRMIDAGKVMCHYPCIPSTVNLDLPSKYVTAQFDCNNVPYYKDSLDARKIPPMKVESILSQYRAQGYEVVFIGGDGKKNMNGPGNLKNIGAALANAKYHVGAESGFLVMAQMYMKPEQIKLYVKKSGGYSHHVDRNVRCGVELIQC